MELDGEKQIPEEGKESGKVVYLRYRTVSSSYSSREKSSYSTTLKKHDALTYTPLKVSLPSSPISSSWILGMVITNEIDLLVLFF